MKIINQGRPASAYFCVAYPNNLETPEVGEEVHCIHPRTNKITKGVYVDRFTFKWTEIADSFCLLQFGINAAGLRQALNDAKPEFRDQEQIRLLIIQETT